MLDNKYQYAAGVLKAIQAKVIEVEAKDEKQAIAKLNKEMKNPEGYGFKIYKSKGYYGKYEVCKTWKNKKQGGSYTEFSLYKKEQGVYAVGDGGNGYWGQD